MEYSKENKAQQEHIASIFKEYTTPSRVLRSFTNLSNSVIETALSGQNKFVFEILQNADDAFEDQHKSIEIKFILQDNYLIVHHNGKGFDFNDVERICDYASQIEEVKATDLSKTGYKGLGFKSLFNLSDSIYIFSNGYSFRFDKTYWPDAESKPWQVIPIWCRYDELPLNEIYPYDQVVNFILKVNDVNKLESQLREVIEQPELLLYLHRIDKLSVNLNGKKYYLERRVETFGVFNKIDFYKNQHLESTWISKVYKQSVLAEVQTFVRGGSRFIYPDKIKNAKQVSFNFALRSDKTLTEISKIRGLCYSTLPTQLHLTLPYHINSLFLLNLDRTQLHENEWNEFLIYQLGYLQFNLLKDLAEVNYLKNFVIQLFVRKINHPYTNFGKAFLKGFMEAKVTIAWLPDHLGKHLLKLGEAWTDETEFFKHNFQNIRDHKIYPYLINYDVKGQNNLYSSEAEAKHFTYDQLFSDFPNKYYPQLTRAAYVNFINYLYERLKGPCPNYGVMSKLEKVPFLLAKDGTLLPPRKALLLEGEDPLPGFLMLNPIDNENLPLKNIELIQWLVHLGARQLTTPIQILRESVLKWIDDENFDIRININNHIGIINYLAKGVEQLTRKETEKLKESLLILTESNQFKEPKLCYLPDAVSIKELVNIISDDEKISSSYDLNNLRGFFIHVGVNDKLNPIDVLQKGILIWIRNGEINRKITISNYKPIIEFVAINYPMLEQNLSPSENKELRQMPVLTCGQLFQKAEVCYFDSAIPNVKGLRDAVAKNKLVPTKNIPGSVNNFFLKIGVSRNIAPADLIRRSILRWIQEGEIRERITHDNHQDILKYICEHWSFLNNQSGLQPKELKELEKIPILTEGDVFRSAHSCYWLVPNFEGSCYEEIPALKSVISSDELVSSCYRSKVIKRLLEDLGVRKHTFIDIYEKYSDHLTHIENVKWFFSKLVDYWEKNKADIDQLLSRLREKFMVSSCLLANNGKMYSSTELYSSQFDNIYDIDQNSILLLEYMKLPEDLERYLGFKTDLSFHCIQQLLEAIEKKPKLGKEKTQIFFTTLLEQLRFKDKNEIKKFQLSLFSKDNKLRNANDLYYFFEENTTCYLDSCYLKRIPGMSHSETLELAELCGVNTLPFKQEIEREDKKYDNTLKEFYLERLSFIVVQESREVNEDIKVTLARFYDMIYAMKLYQCNNINVKYPFGEPTKIPFEFDDLTLYVVGNWVKKKSRVHDYISNKLGITTDIRDIIDMELPITTKEKQDWLTFQNVNPEDLYFVEVELKKHLSCDAKQDIDALIRVEVIKEELISPESASDENLVENYQDELYFKKEDTIKDKCNAVDSTSIDEQEAIQATATDSTIAKNFIELGIRCLVSSELEIDRKIQMQQPEITGSCYSSTLLSTKAKNDENITHIEVNKEELIEPSSDPESSSHENSIDNCEDESYLKKEYTIDEGGGAYSTFTDTQEFSIHEATINSIMADNIIVVDSRCLVSSELEINCKTQTQQPEITGSYSSMQILHTSFSRNVEEATSEQAGIKWLSEKYVFTFLQDHYKNKYPNSQFNLSAGIFTLLWQTHKFEICWLNASLEKNQSYDLVLKKDGEIKRLIEVKSTNDMANDSFNISHRKFVRKVSQLEAELPGDKEKYCIYCVINTNNSPTICFEKLNNSAAIYKVVPLKNL